MILSTDRPILLETFQDVPELGRIVLIIGEPIREATALSFWLKMILLMIGVGSVLHFHRALAGHTGTEFPSGIKTAAVATLAVWIAIIFLGRAIAYAVAVWGTWSFGA